MDQKQKRRQVYFNIQNMRKTLKITEDLHQRIKVFCAINNLKINDWVESELKKILNTNDSK